MLLAALDADSLVIRCRPGGALRLSDAQAVAVVPGTSRELEMKYFDLAQFELLGNRIGAAESFEDGRLPGTRPATSPANGGLVRRASTRTDLSPVKKSPVKSPPR